MNKTNVKGKKMNVFTVKLITRSALFTAIICVLSVIAIPAGPIPFTLGLAAILLTAVILSPLEAIIAVMAYILLGSIGLPVFSGGGSGIGVLLGPTGGYIFAYPITAVIVSVLTSLTTKSVKNSVVLMLLAFLYCVIGVIVLYSIGTLYFSHLTSRSYAQSLAVCVYPFVPFDTLKCVIAAVIGIKVKNIFYKHTN